MSEEFRRLVAASSFGTPEVQAACQSVDDETVAEVVRRASCGWPGHCQSCGAPLTPPNAISCRACGRSDVDE